MQKKSQFIDAIEKYYTADKSVALFYSKLLCEMVQKNLVDTNFVSQMNDLENTRQRLSELLVVKHCVDSGLALFENKKKAPDIIFEFGGRNVNIELVTPVKVAMGKLSFSQVDCTPFNYGELKRGSTKTLAPDIDSLHARITSCLRDKADKFGRYISDGAVSLNDVNIVCINLGFIEGNEFIDYPYLRNIFHRQAAIHVDVDAEMNVSYEVLDFDFCVTKNEKVVLTTSYFDNEDYAHIDGVWLVGCNEGTKDYIKNPIYSHDCYQSVLYRREGSKVSQSLLSVLNINSPVEESFVEGVRKYGVPPV